jgi:hypothetical protein
MRDAAIRSPAPQLNRLTKMEFHERALLNQTRSDQLRTVTLTRIIGAAVFLVQSLSCLVVSSRS